MNWQGLMNWSMQYTDGTRPSEFKPMDEETKQWLKEALESYIVDDVEVVRKGSQILSELETGSDEERIKKENAADLILNSVENLDVAVNLVKINGFKHIIRCMIGSQYISVRRLCASIFSTSVQNNPPVQRNAFDEHAVEGLLAIIPNEQDLQLKEQYVSCLSGLVRGEYYEPADKFVEIGGLELVAKLLFEFQSVRIVKKLLLMVSDLLYNSRRRGDDRVTRICEKNGLIESIVMFTKSDDQEVAEMARWAIHNSLINLSTEV